MLSKNVIMRAKERVKVAASPRKETADPTTLQKAIKKIKERKERGKILPEPEIPVLDKPLPGGYGRRVGFMGIKRIAHE